MQYKLLLSISLSSFLLCQQTLALSDSSVTYKNQRGSVLVLTWHPDNVNTDTGTLTGTFTTAVARCKDTIGAPQPITGYFNGNVVTYSVNFPSCKSAAAMTGHLSADKNNLVTLWFVADQADDPTGKDFDSSLVGTDSYHRID